MSTALFVVTMIVAGIAIWIHGYRVARRHPPRFPRRSKGDYVDPHLYKALRLLVLALLFVGGVAHADPSPRRLTARVTFYEPRSCPYGNVTSTGRYATEGVTVAVDPKVIPYGSRVRIRELDGLVGDGWFIAQDTGSAVKSRKASRRWGSRAPVIDVYIASPRRLRQVEKAAPMFCLVEVHR